MNKTAYEKIIARMDHLEPNELRRVFMRLNADKGVLQDIFDALRDGLILFDGEGHPTLANKAAARIYDRPLRDVLREPFEVLAGGTCTWEELKESGVEISRDLQVNYPAPRHYNFYIAPIGDGAEYLLLVQDDTETRVQNEEDTESQQFNLLSYMASAIAHEIGNPLNSLGLNLQLLKRRLAKMPAAQDPTVESLLETAMQETRRLDTLLKQFLQSMRPTKPQRRPIDINRVLQKVLALLEPEIAPRGITVRTSLTEHLPNLQADENQLFQVFYNIIRNAYQSIPGGEGDIYLQTDYNDNFVRILVRDSGSGISHEVMGSLYEAFRTTKKKGNGLGLLIVRRIVKDHGGALAFASKTGEGTQVTVTLPRADRVVRLLPA